MKVFLLSITILLYIEIVTSLKKCNRSEIGSLRPDSKDCSKYYRCENESPNDQYWKHEECPPYEYFNNTISNCLSNYDSCTSALSSPYITCPNSVKIGDPGNSNVYFQCHQNTWLPKKCEDNTIFNDNTKRCQSGENYCSPGLIKEDSNSCDKYYECDENGKWISVQCKARTYFNSKKNMCIYDSENICNEEITTRPPIVLECISETVKPDLQNCSRYFICKKETWQLKMCPENNYFDIFFLECRYDYDGSCSKKKEIVVPTRKPIEKCIEGTKKQDPLDCGRYYTCSLNEWMSSECKGNTYYSSKRKRCVFNDGTCIRNDVEIITSTSMPIDNCVAGETREDPNDCRSFYLCLSNQWIRSKCKTGYYYSKFKQSCVPEDGSCSPTKKPIVGECIEGATKQDILDCGRYYTCSLNEWMSSECKGNTYYSSKKKRCVFNDGTCIRNDVEIITPTSMPIDNCVAGETREDPNDCRSFYLCLSNKWIRTKCETGYYYSKFKQSCVPEDGSCSPTKKPIVGECIEGATKQDALDCGRYYICLLDKWVSAECKDNTYYDISRKQCIFNDGICDRDEVDFDCTDGDMKPDQISCNRYYYCRNNKMSLFTCPDKYYFNETFKHCLPNVGICDTIINDSTDSECTEGTLKMNSKNLSSYFACIKTKWVLKVCPSNTRFDMISSKCKENKKETEYEPTSRPKPEVKCKDGTYKLSELSTSTYYICQNFTWKMKSCPNGFYFDLDSTICIPDFNARKMKEKKQ